MQTILAQFHLDAHSPSLSQELSGVDQRQLLDIGLVRAADGSLRLSEDPAQPIAHDLPQQHLKAFFEALTGAFRWTRGLPLRSPNWHPHFFLRE